MLTLESIMKAAKQAASYGEGKHYFAGGPWALRSVPEQTPKKKKQRRQPKSEKTNDDQPDQG